MVVPVSASVKTWLRRGWSRKRRSHLRFYGASSSDYPAMFEEPTKLFADEEDEMHGQYEPFEVPLPNGASKTVMVSEKWIRITQRRKSMEAAPTEWVRVNFMGPRGRRVEILEVGREVPADVVRNNRDPETGELFGVYAFRDGEEVCHVMQKELFDRFSSAIKVLVEEGVNDALTGAGDEGRTRQAEALISEDGLRSWILSKLDKPNPNPG